MAENKKSVLLYCDIIHTVKELTNEEAGKLFKHYLEYINDLNPNSDRLTELLFEPIKQNLKRDLKKWESKSIKNSVIAKEAWEKRKDANASERIKSDAINADKVTVIVTDKVKDKVIVTDKGNINSDFLLKKETKFDFRKKLIEYGFSDNLVDDWIKVRKTKKATNTETAFKGFIDEIKKRDCDINFVLKKMVEKNWQGFSWSWIDFDKNMQKPSKIEKSLDELKEGKELIKKICDAGN